MPELDTGHWSIEHVRLPAGFGGGRLSSIARHASYDQVFVGIDGVIALAVAEPTAPASTPDPDAISVFALRAGRTVLVRRGTWHTTVPLDGGAEFVNITRRDDGETPGELGDADRAYVTTIEFDVPVGIGVSPDPPSSATAIRREGA